MIVLGKFSIKEFTIHNFEEIVLPSNMLLDPANDTVEAPHDPRFQISQKIHAFAARAGEVNSLTAFQTVD